MKVKNSALLAVNGSANAHNLRGIQVVTKYCYLAATVNDSDSIFPHLLRQRSSYLRSYLRYHACPLSFENQYLRKAVYVLPYLMYVAPLLEA